MLRVNSEMLPDAQKYIEIVHNRGQRTLKLERVYRNLQKPGLFLLAYNELYANKGATTTGTDPVDTIQNMSLEQVESIIEELRTGTYKWKPARRTYIKKANGKTRPLGLPSWRDKLLQGVLRLVLNAFYEPQFSANSHGFRPGRGCHTALADIVNTWNGTTWFIEGDIKGCFDHINHNRLLEILGKKIEDARLLKLLREMLAAGYLEDWSYHNTYSGTPQGGVVSPILANIYLHELDEYVEQVLIPKYTRGDSKKRTRNPAYQQASSARARAKQRGDAATAQAALKRMHSLPSFVADEGFRRLRYVRYADDFLLGFIGTKKEAEEIREEVRNFLQRHLQLNMSEEKTLITHAKDSSAKFLGYEVNIATNDTKQKAKRRCVNGMPMLRAPAKVICTWSKKFQKANNTVGRKELMNMSEYDIVTTYAAEYNGIVNYYEMALNRAVFHTVKGHFTESLVKTLAEKAKCKTSEIYQRHQKVSKDGLKCIVVRIEREGKKPLVASLGGQSLKYHRLAKHLNDQKQARYFSRNQQSDRLLAEQCELCGQTGPLQGHHVRKLKDLRKKYQGRKEPPAWVRKMLEINRKTLFLCKDCHSAIHSGRYDGRKVV